MIVNIVSVLQLMGLALLGTGSVLAQASDRLCAELDNVRPGEFLHGQTDLHLTTSTLRPLQEPASVGRSIVKGAMARRLSHELESGPVGWSGALLVGPVLCGPFHAYQVLVNPLTVRLSPP